MKLIDVKIGKIKIPLKRPFKTALRTTHFVEDIILKIYTDNDLIGYGSCAQTPAITGETFGSLIDALHIIKSKILNYEFDSLEKILNLIHSLFVNNTSARACFDIALHDIYSQYLNLPLYKYLGGDHNTVFTSLTISMGEIHTMIADCHEAIAAGFHELKIKLGVDPKNDFARMHEISKAVGPKIKLRVDANQGWSPKLAVQLIQLMEKENLNIEFIEQPVKASDIDGLAFVRQHVSFDILADESVFSPQDTLSIVTKKAADLISIKLAKAGGILQATKILHIAEAANIECFVGCMLESHISITAACHFAAAKKSILRCDLDSSFLILENPIESCVSMDGNALTLDKHVVGLGIKHIHGFEPIT